MFGTDGIRGRANVDPMLPETVLRVGMAVGMHFGRGGRVVVGKDTRRSGYMFETALASGLTSVGADVMLVGPMPTPGIAYITHSMRANAGVVISASHNPFEDNGIKLFGRDGFKLPDEVELELERLSQPGAADGARATGASIGRATRIEDAPGRYITHAKQAFLKGARLDGIKIVVDCAHGAAYRIAPMVFAELGAKVIPIGVSPDGVNINEGCGATAPEAMAAKVREVGADLGVALDGDADRAVFCDAQGTIVDGDRVLAILALDAHGRDELPGAAVVATVMSNLGLERALAGKGIGLVRAAVGDRYVVEEMRARDLVLGGEQSGHLICLEHATTGDGIVTALALLSVMVASGRSLSELSACMRAYPQMTRSFPVDQKPPLSALAQTRVEIEAVERRLGEEGRVLVRYSGTESKLRVMVEGPDAATLTELVAQIGDAAVAEIRAIV